MTRDRTILTLQKSLAVLAGFFFLLLAVAIAGLSIGSVPIPFGDVVASLWGSHETETTLRTIVLDIRLPRILLAIIVGAGLSIAGVVLQALLRNPLAEPYVLGISSGGTVGVILVLAFSTGAAFVATPLASLLGSVLVMVLVYSLAQRRGQLDTNALLLAGVMVGAFFNAAVLMIIAISDRELRTSFLWLMGNFSTASMDTLRIIMPLVILASIPLLLQAKRFNLIATGDDTALQLGVDVKRIKRISYLLASIITGLVVSVSGVIGFVGLIIPHICRMLFGPDHRLLLPVSMLFGASFMIVADLLSRTLLAPTEIPVGAVTAAIGAPMFIYLLRKTG